MSGQAGPSGAIRSTPALRFSGVAKRFGSTVVLDDVSFDIESGEIHALLGANGAGKSTLIKVLAGVHKLDSGAIEVHGAPLSRGHLPDEARSAGIAFVHQDLGLIDELSVADNIALQLGFDRRRGLVDDRATATRAAHALAEVGADFSPHRLVGSLSRDEKVLCALARALAMEPRIVVLDEVSASLPKPEADRLAASLRTMRRGGAAFLYVTHRLDELAGLVDSVTVLRNGRKVLSAPMASLSHDALVRQIVGTRAGSAPKRPARRPERERSEPHLVVRDLSIDGSPLAISFEVHAGEVLGICGLVGSGTRELAQTLAGRRRPARGTATLTGRLLGLGDPRSIARSGCTVVPGDRQREGVVTELGVRENMLPTRREFGAWSPLGFRYPRRETRAVLNVADDYGVVPGDDADRAISQLSGGNQQKIIFARALADRPAVAVLEDPTAGVDIGSRGVLYDLMHDAARSGTAVVLISTDFDEVAEQSHRVIVLSHGKVVAEFPDAHDIDADRLAEASYATIADAPSHPAMTKGDTGEDDTR